MYKINVLIVTYNQEDVIARTLESILCQREWGLNNIIVCDDCSKDNTWEILKDYAERYPEIVIPYRNEKNLGIYGNTQKLFSLCGDADLYTDLAGDDTICDGWFRTVQQWLEDHKVKLSGEAVTLCSDFVIIRPDGARYVNRNNKLVGRKGVDLVSLKIRNIISARSTMISRKAIEKYGPIDLKFGLGVAEITADLRPFIFSDFIFYIPFVATTYYTQIGVSTRLSTPEYFNECIKKYNYILSNFKLDNKAKLWISYMLRQRSFQLQPTYSNYFKLCVAYWRAFDRYTIYGKANFFLNIKRMIDMVRTLLGAL